MIWLLWLPVTLAAPRVFPLVDPGLFVISGVKTCGGGGGYCLLGLDCTLDEDFLPDDEAGQHCEGLKSAFTPSAHFVCCRATNNTIYKPPIVFPSVLTTIHTEPVTVRTTTLDLLENEIDEVLLKVAESINSVKKTPVTEATEPETDVIDEVELRESVIPSAQEGSLKNGEMLADSPIGNGFKVMLEAGKDPEERIVLEDSKIKEPAPLVEPPHKIEQIPQNNSLLKTVLQENIGELSKEKSTEENLISLEKFSNESDDEETGADENSSVIGINSEKTVSSQENSSKFELKAQEALKNYTQEDISAENITEEMSVLYNFKEYSSGNTSSKENSLQNNVLNHNIFQGFKKENESITEDAVDENIPEIEDLTTSKPNILKDLVMTKNVSNDDAEWTQIKLNKTTKLPVLDKISDNYTESNITSPTNNLNDVSMLNSPGKDQVNNTLNDDDNEEMLLSDEIETNVTSDLASQTNKTVTKEDQFVTSTTMYPATQTPHNDRPTANKEVEQGQLHNTQTLPGVAMPCSRVASRDCTEEVKFVFQNETLCFGSIYAVDWIITSASCALRIFRAGMLNITILTLKDTQRADVKTIIVHESYGENAGTSGQEMEANNIGLVQLKTPVAEWAPCVPCLPDRGEDFSNANCTAVTTVSPSGSDCSTPGSCKSSRAESSMPTCESIARSMTDDHSFPYITLACETLWEPRFIESSRKGSGAPLFCNGVLAGVESSTGIGMIVYTPLSGYLDWLVKNTRSAGPEQYFNVG